MDCSLLEGWIFNGLETITGLPANLSLMRGTPTYLDSSAGSVFYRASKRERLLFLFAGFLFLYGCYKMSQAGLPESSENAGDFVIGAGIASFGFFVSWFNGRRWMGLMLAVALVSRLILMPMPASEDLSRRMWEGEVLDLSYNPYEVAPNDRDLEPLRGGDWERMRRKDQVSQQTPLSLAIFRLAETLGLNEWGLKLIFIVFDIWICIMLAFRFGSRKAALYAWNPLVAYSVAGGGHMESLVLLPALGGFLIWDAWVDRKGGAVVINANGGLGGGLGQMVCFAALLMGLAAAMNLVFLPIALWMAWQVLSKSGVKAGLAILLVSLIPLLAFTGWGALSLEVDLDKLLPIPRQPYDEAISLLPGLLDRMGIELEGVYYTGIAGLIALILMFRNESLERYGNLYLGAALLIGVAVYPWQFLWLAPFAVGASHLGFRLVSISAFVYFLGARELGGAFELTTLQSAALWGPFALGIIGYALLRRSKSDGLYVRSY